MTGYKDKEYIEARQALESERVAAKARMQVLEAKLQAEWTYEDDANFGSLYDREEKIGEEIWALDAQAYRLSVQAERRDQ